MAYANHFQGADLSGKIYGIVVCKWFVYAVYQFSQLL